MNNHSCQSRKPPPAGWARGGATLICFEAEECGRELERLAVGRSAGAARPPVDPVPAPGKEFVVAPDGNDANPGTDACPFATLLRARDAVRALIGRAGRPTGSMAVVLKPGEYLLRGPLVLTAQDARFWRESASDRYRSRTLGSTATSPAAIFLAISPRDA